MREALCNKIVDGLISPELKEEADKIFHQIERIDSARFDIPRVINMFLFLVSLIVCGWLIPLAVDFFVIWGHTIATKIKVFAVLVTFAFIIAGLHFYLLPNLLDRVMKPVIEKRKSELLDLVNSDYRTNQAFRKIFSVVDSEPTENISKYLH